MVIAGITALAIIIGGELKFTITPNIPRIISLARFLSEKTGHSFELIASRNVGEFMWASKAADFSLVDPLQYFILNRTQGAYPVLKVIRKGSDRLRGAIISKERISIRELDRRTVIASSKLMLQGYLIQYELLRRRRIKPQVVLGFSQEEIAKRAVEGKAVGFVREDAVPSGVYAVYTPPYPGDLVIAYPETPTGIVVQVKEYLVGLTQSAPEILRALEIDKFAPITEGERLKIERFIRRLVRRAGLPF